MELVSIPGLNDYKYFNRFGMLNSYGENQFWGTLNLEIKKRDTDEEQPATSTPNKVSTLSPCTMGMHHILNTHNPQHRRPLPTPPPNQRNELMYYKNF